MRNHEQNICNLKLPNIYFLTVQWKPTLNSTVMAWKKHDEYQQPRFKR